MHNFKEWSVLCTKLPFGDVPQTNFSYKIGTGGKKIISDKLIIISAAKKQKPFPSVPRLSRLASVPVFPERFLDGMSTRVR